MKNGLAVLNVVDLDVVCLFVDLLLLLRAVVLIGFGSEKCEEFLV